MALQNDSIKNNVLQAIQSGRVVMQPKWKFVLRTLLMVVGTILVTLTALYIASFIVFMLRQNGAWFAPGFGLRGWQVFLSSLPWILLLVSIIFIVLLELLIKHYSFGYGKPLLYSALGVVALVIAGGIILGFSPLHDRLFDQTERGNFQFGAPLYHQFGQPPRNVTVGRVQELLNPDFTIRGREDHIFRVVISDDTELPPGGIRPGDVIVVLGERDDDSIDADAVQKPAMLPPPRHRFMPAR